MKTELFYVVNQNADAVEEQHQEQLLMAQLESAATHIFNIVCIGLIIEIIVLMVKFIMTMVM